MKKKCPVCNSNRTHENKKYFVCDKCGYLLKKKNGILGQEEKRGCNKE